MAGKTIRGAGVDGESSRRTERDGTPVYGDDDDDARGVHSGPTVVDDEKVAEVLKKLRTLDRPPGPLTGVTQAVVDTNSSEQTRIDSGPIPAPDSAVARRVDSGPTTKVAGGQASLQDLMYPLQRSTAIGRSLSTPTDLQPLNISSDAARGTMLGRSIHLADANAPREASIELSSGAVEFVEGTAPSQPFPVAERPVVALPAPTAPAQRFHTPYDNTDPRTDRVGRPRSKVARVIALLGGFAAVAGGWYAWTQMRGKPTDAGPPTAASTAASTAAAPANPAAAPSIMPIPAPAEPAALPPGAPAPTPPAPSAAPVDQAPPPRAAAADAPAPATTRHKSPTAARRRAARIVAPSEPTEPPTASKPVRSRHRDTIPADPDATLPPSM